MSATPRTDYTDVTARWREIQRTSSAADYARDNGDNDLAASLTARTAALVTAFVGREQDEGAGA